MQQIVNVIPPPAVSPALLSLDEAKLALNIPQSDTSKDASLTMLIKNTSDVLAVLTNRVFVKEKVQEDFYGIDDGERRIFFSRWPVKKDDIETLTNDGSDILASPDWVLEEKTGTLFKPGGSWSGDVSAVYSGGYVSPDEVPPALKQAAIAVVRDAYYAMIRGALLSGVRMIAHKQARVMYYPSGPQGSMTTGGGTAASPATQKAIDALLGHYVRHFM